jgi:hypothetical protein
MADEKQPTKRVEVRRQSARLRAEWLTESERQRVEGCATVGEDGYLRINGADDCRRRLLPLLANVYRRNFNPMAAPLVSSVEVPMDAPAPPASAAAAAAAAKPIAKRPCGGCSRNKGRAGDSRT